MGMNKWKIAVRFIKDKSDKSDARQDTYYKLFKARMLDKNSGIRCISSSDFNDYTKSMTHICDKPMDVIDYFYNLNATDGSLDLAEVTISRLSDYPRPEKKTMFGKKNCIEHGKDVIKLNKEKKDHE